jgi:hypothetical protein
LIAKIDLVVHDESPKSVSMREFARALPLAGDFRELLMLDSRPMRKRWFTAIAFVIVCTAVATLLAPKNISGSRERVREQVPPDFPVAVRDVGSSTVRIHPHIELAKATRLVNASFLIGEPAPDGITIEASSEGKQSLRVQRRVDRNTTAIGWYHATEREVFPQFFELRKESRDRHAMFRYGGIAFGTSTALALLFSMVFRPRRKQRIA